MSLLEQIETNSGADEIVTGKRLIRVGDDRGVMILERWMQLLKLLA